jgi:hypothetical protein
MGIVLMQYIEFPLEINPSGSPKPQRDIKEITSQPIFIVAAICAALGYGIMNLLMAATPLAMEVCGHPFSSTALVLEFHVISMFAPGFFTGSLIKRFGKIKIMLTGLLLNALCVAIALDGVDLHHFIAALICLGVGWNFLFTGATTMAMETYRPEEKNKAQAAINFFVFSTMALTSFGFRRIGHHPRMELVECLVCNFNCHHGLSHGVFDRETEVQRQIRAITKTFLQSGVAIIGSHQCAPAIPLGFKLMNLKLKNQIKERSKALVMPLTWILTGLTYVCSPNA